MPVTLVEVDRAESYHEREPVVTMENKGQLRIAPVDFGRIDCPFCTAQLLREGETVRDHSKCENCHAKVVKIEKRVFTK